MDRGTLMSHNPHIKSRHSPHKSQECLQLTGSQMNLTSRSQKSLPKSPTHNCVWKSRPCSAFQCYNPYMDCKSKWNRPMSAGNDFPLCKMSKHISAVNVRGSTCSEDPTAQEPDPNFKHCYTYMSSNLLRSLIRNPWNSECSESSSTRSELSHSEKSLGCLIREMAQNNSHDSLDKDENAKLYLKDSSESKDSDSEIKNDKYFETVFHCHEGLEKESGSTGKSKSRIATEKIFESRNSKFQRWFQQSTKDEKIVRFSREESVSDNGNVRNEDEISEHHSRPMLEYKPEEFSSSGNKDDDTSCSTVITENGDPKNDYENFKERPIDEICHYKKDDFNNADAVEKVIIDGTCSKDCPFSCCKPESNSEFYSEAEIGTEQSVKTDEESKDGKEKDENEALKTLKCIKDENMETEAKDSTYDEIVTIINVLEQEETNSLLNNDIEDVPKVNKNKKSNQLQDIFSYLDEVEKTSQETINVAKCHLDTVRSANHSALSISSIPRLEELINKNTVDLAHEILSLKLQIEDQSSGIKLLQKTIADMKEAAIMAKRSHEDEIMKISNDAEATIQRHQKFIKQLLQEKKSLNEKVAKLVEDLKSGEERYQRNLKTIEQRHAIEIQRVKETQAVAEKLKREKWIDIKTQKIKEMTVKGLEPELSRMAARQQQEIADLRNLHRAELEAVELRATRRTTELLEELRSELSKDKEEAILRETNNLRTKLEKQFEDERTKLEYELRKLREERRREKEILEGKESQMQDTYAEMKRALEREKERERQRIIQEHQEQMEALKRRHQNDIKSVRESLEIEKEAWMNNFKKQQNAKFLEREAELHHQYKKERDMEIEMVIEKIENEASKAQQELNQTAENKLKRMKEKFDEEIKEMETTEAMLKAKLSDSKAQLLEKDDRIAELNAQVHHLQSDMSHLRKLCEEMSAERTNLKQIISKEFEAQLAQAGKEQEELRNEISTLKRNHILELAKKEQMVIQVKAGMQQELNQVYNRVKITVSKKEEALELLREQHKSVLERCSHLEKMLENQRRNLLLK